MLATANLSSITPPDLLGETLLGSTVLAAAPLSPSVHGQSMAAMHPCAFKQQQGIRAKDLGSSAAAATSAHEGNSPHAGLRAGTEAFHFLHLKPESAPPSGKCTVLQRPQSLIVYFWARLACFGHAMGCVAVQISRTVYNVE